MATSTRASMAIMAANRAGPRIKMPKIWPNINPITGSRSITLICWASLKPLTLAEIITVRPILHRAKVGATPNIRISQVRFGSDNMPLNKLKVTM